RSSAGTGIRLLAEQTAVDFDGERKTVTALFADIKGSTELMAELDPEEARSLIDPALKLMIEAVRRYDGYIVQSTGDGIFALLDHPRERAFAYWPNKPRWISTGSARRSRRCSPTSRVRPS